MALPLGGPGRVVHEDGLDEGAVREPMKGLLGLSGIRRLELGFGDGVETKGRIDLGPEGSRQGPRLARSRGSPAPDGISDLARPIRRLATFREPRLEDAGLEAGQPGPWVAIRA